jgi:hypothetical protein
MKNFKFFTRDKINLSYPEGILNGYYNHNMPYDDLRPYYKSCCGVDVFSEVMATTYDELMLLDNWVNVWVLGMRIDGVVYCSEGIQDDWDFPDNWESDKKYIYEYMIITYPMLDETNINEDSWNEVVNDIENAEVSELPQREVDTTLRPESNDGVYIRTSDRLVMMEDIITFNL